MIEEEVDVEILAADLEPDLLADEREAGPELDQELPDVGEEPFLERLLLGLVGERQELKLYGSFSVSRARSDWGAGRVRSKFVWALP